MGIRLFDLHCDTAYKCYTEKVSLFRNDFHISIERGVNYTPWVQCFAVWMPDEKRGREAIDFFRAVAESFLMELQEHSDIISQYHTADDLDNERNLAILTVEGGGAIGGELETLDLMHEYGVKLLTLTWNSRCELGSGALDDEDIGLTDFGKAALDRMSQLSIIPDLSHSSQKLFWDVCEHTDQPLVVSHSNMQTVCPHPRNLTDEQFREIVRRRGLVGLNFYTRFLDAENPEDISSLLRHIDHMLSLGGEKTIALGGDLDGADLPSYIGGIQSMSTLRDSLLSFGYGEALCDALFYENAYNFFRRIEGRE